MGGGPRGSREVGSKVIICDGGVIVMTVVGFDTAVGRGGFKADSKTRHLSARVPCRRAVATESVFCDQPGNSPVSRFRLAEVAVVGMYRWERSV
jgi:hypothetical protein